MAERRIEEIGKVKLDYSRYPGKDFYSEGKMEDELLEIARNRTAAEYEGIIEERRVWPILYHLSPLRENIVDWIPMDRGCKVLEVGSGCGAITGALSRKAGTVTCLELSKKRSLINAYRHRDCDNVTIHVGNFRDIEPELPEDFDYICLIGVFEYGQAYMGGERPYEDYLKKLMGHLAPGGRIIIAIENKYGLKYFAGCREDHLGTYFSGIENYASGGDVRTFGRGGLEDIFERCGAEEWHFYYPYPDYKFMTSLYSDEYLPKKGELFNNLRNFDRSRMLLFNEKNAFDGLVEEGLFPVFSNSYLAVIGGGFDTKFVKYSNDRAPEYAIRTEILSGWADRRNRVDMVRKYPMSSAADAHVKGMEAAYESLRERYQGGELSINTCELVREKGQLFAQFEYVEGVPLLEVMDACLERGDIETFRRFFREFLKRAGYNSDYPAADFDLVFGNVLIRPRAESGSGKGTSESGTAKLSLEGGRSSGDILSEGVSPKDSISSEDIASEEASSEGVGDVLSEGRDSALEALLQGEWTLIDYEWTFGKPMDTKQLALRAACWYLREDEKRKKISLDWILRELSMTEKDVKDFWEEEGEFQRFVTGNRSSMAEMREKIGCRVMNPQDWLDRYQDSEDVNKVQIYEDRGQGYSEENSYFVRDAYQGDWLIELELKVSGEVEMLRIDPGMYPCMVKLAEMTFNGEPVPLHRRKMLYANGRIVKPPKGKDKKGERDCPSIVFATEDPNINIVLKGLKRETENTLHARIEIVRLPLSMAQDLI